MTREEMQELPTGAMKIKAINPSNGVILKEYDEMPPQEVGNSIRASGHAFLDWRKTSFAERAELLRKAAGILRSSAEDYARLMALEMGKPIRDGKSEAEKCAWACDYFAANGELFLAPEILATDAGKSYVTIQIQLIFRFGLVPVV